MKNNNRIASALTPVALTSPNCEPLVPAQGLGVRQPCKPCGAFDHRRLPRRQVAGALQNADATRSRRLWFKGPNRGLSQAVATARGRKDAAELAKRCSALTGRVFKRALRSAGAVKLLPLALLLTLPTVVQAQFTYTTNNGTITITGYTGLGGVVIIPSTITGLPVTSIGDSAFQYSGILTRVTIGTNVTSIGDYAFEGCDNLSSVTIPNSVTSIGLQAFANISSLNSVTIPNGVSSIGAGAFYECDNLTSVTIGTNVTSIGDSAFSECSKLTSVTIPNSVTNLGDYAFRFCPSLTAITVGTANPVYSSMDGVLFDKSHTTLIEYPGGKAGPYIIPIGVTSIADNAFAGSATTLTSVTIPNSVTNIGQGAFYSCSSLTSVTIPDSVTSIGRLAFQYCNSLTSVTIPNSVTSIGDQAFYGCSSLASVTIGIGVTYIGGKVFETSRNLTAITVDALNSAYSSVDGVLFDKSQATLIQCPEGKAGSDYTVPNNVKSIGYRAFANCNSLTSVTIPNSVTNIGEQAFGSSTSLASVTIGNGVTSLASGPFISCTSLTSITIPNSVTNIGDRAFDYCTSLTSITIPASVLFIAYEAFSRCASLTEVYFQGNAPSLSSDVFLGDDNATVYYLPGTTGWGPTFGGRPTALWFLPYPLILTTSGSSFGVRTNRFGSIISWAANNDVAVDACTNLANPVWVPVGTNTLTDGWAYFSDPQWRNYHARFYRLRSP